MGATTELGDYIEKSKCVSVHRLLASFEPTKPVRLTCDREINAARFGIRFYTRVKFCLRDTTFESGDYYVLTNSFFLDFIEDISMCALSPKVVMYTDSGLEKTLDEPTPIPVINNATAYRFKKCDVDLDAELVGVVFGNRVRKLMNSGEKVLYSNHFVTMYTFPFVISPFIGNEIFALGIETKSENDVTQEEMNLVNRWKFFKR